MKNRLFQCWVVVLAVALVWGDGVAAWAAPLAQEGQDMAAFDKPEWGMTMQYPADWTAEDLGDVVRFTADDYSAFAVMQDEAFLDMKRNLSGVTQIALNKLGVNNMGLRVKPQPGAPGRREALVSGVEATYYVGWVGYVIQFAVNGQGYLILCSAVADEFAGKETVFSAIAESIKFEGLETATPTRGPTPRKKTPTPTRPRRAGTTPAPTADQPGGAGRYESEWVSFDYPGGWSASSLTGWEEEAAAAYHQGWDEARVIVARKASWAGSDDIAEIVREVLQSQLDLMRVTGVELGEEVAPCDLGGPDSHSAAFSETEKSDFISGSAGGWSCVFTRDGMGYAVIMIARGSSLEGDLLAQSQAIKDSIVLHGGGEATAVPAPDASPTARATRRARATPVSEASATPAPAPAAETLRFENGWAAFDYPAGWGIAQKTDDYVEVRRQAVDETSFIVARDPAWAEAPEVGQVLAKLARQREDAESLELETEEIAPRQVGGQDAPGTSFVYEFEFSHFAPVRAGYIYLAALDGTGYAVVGQTNGRVFDDEARTACDAILETVVLGDEAAGEPDPTPTPRPRRTARPTRTPTPRPAE